MFLSFSSHGCHRHPLGGIFSISETKERLHGFENVARVPVDKVVMGDILILDELSLQRLKVIIISHNSLS